MKMRTYRELITIPSFEDRVRYLQLSGMVGKDTFGFDRYLNQEFYRDPTWRKIRNKAILRDSLGKKECYDLGCKDIPIAGFIYVHHIEPITKEDILSHSDKLIDLDNLICCSKRTHDLIHYGAEADIKPLFTERAPNDTCPWKTGE